MDEINLLSASIESQYKEYHSYNHLFKTMDNDDVIWNIQNKMSRYFNTQTMAHFYIKEILKEEPYFNDKNKLVYDKATLIVDYYKKCLITWGRNLIRNNHELYIFNGTHYENYSHNDGFSNLLLDAVGVGISGRTTKDLRDIDDRLKKLNVMEYKKQTKNLIPLKNCVLDILSNGKIEIIKHSYLNMNFYCLPYSYDAKAKCNEFQKFLDSSLPDKDLQMILQEFIGWCLLHDNTKETKFEKALFLYGKGSNGKSVLYEIVCSLFGRENVSMFQLADLTTNANSRASAKNALVNFCSDIERNGKIEHGTLKAMISGEAVQFKLMRQDVTTEDWKPKLIFNANNMPNHAEFTDAFFRRLIVIPFEKQFRGNEIDTGIADRVIKNELSGILNWAIIGLQRLLANKGFTQSVKSTKAINQYKDDVDTVKMWVNENEIDTGTYGDSQIEGQIMYNRFRDFCRDSGIDKYILTKQSFFKRLEDMGFTSIIVRSKKYIYVKSRDINYLTRFGNGLRLVTE